MASRDCEIKSYVEEDVVIALDEVADEMGLSRSQAIRYFVRKGIKRYHRHLRLVQDDDLRVEDFEARVARNRREAGNTSVSA